MKKKTGERSGAKHWKALLLIALIPTALLGLSYYLFRDQLRPAVAVEVGRVILLQHESGETTSAKSSELMFQASGWVEPNPWPIEVPVKVDGFVEEVFVREGDAVTNGQLVATLDVSDAELALAAAKAAVAERKAKVLAQQSAIAEARKRAAAGVSLVNAAVARAADDRDRWKRLSEASPKITSELERVTAEQALVENEAQEAAARATHEAMEAAVKRHEAEASVMDAALAAAEARLDMAKLAVDRCEIRVPQDGVVLRRYVNPGDKRRAGADDRNSATIITLFKPTELQIRVDVPLDEAGGLAVGQPAKISSALLPGQTMSGRVIQIVGQADLQRNTLQAKVAIDQPDPRLRPEVLCRVEFWSDATEQVQRNLHTLWVPEAAVQETGTIWVIDPLSSEAEQRTVKLGQKKDGFLLVLEGLRANETVVTGGAENLEEGARVRLEEVQP